MLISLNWIGDKHNISESSNALPEMIILMAKNKHFMYYVQEPEGITHPTHHLSRVWLPPSVEQRWAPNIHLFLLFLLVQSISPSFSGAYIHLLLFPLVQSMAPSFSWAELGTKYIFVTVPPSIEHFSLLQWSRGWHLYTIVTIPP